ncbi:hypothetical protein A7Q01_04610 [Eikenella sp. NML96-A-049]|uniref:hypothetical protein n=1 Tax=unclassified Eikenella TaxID=2639367 RepID=UPI0007DFC0A5|nr:MULTISPECIES: hypothetical protein [unclassified Eikenella]OAM34015.1 hypothetical protein A7P97_01955 [Eikenella sp. NML070372]OAM38761.1 hypothetical protein A7Q01_04610 [Eikenella sp. NML96-A-049]VDH01170.1 Uncharacterised protein [Helicobacter pametensis]
MKKSLALLLLASFAVPAFAQTRPGTDHASLAAECEQLIKDTNTLANGTLCYRESPEASSYFNDLSMILLFNHPKVDQCRQQARQSPNQSHTARPTNADLGKLCAESRVERARLRREIETYLDSKMAGYAAAEAPKRGISAAELLHQTRAKETERRAKVDAAIRRIDGR